MIFRDESNYPFFLLRRTPNVPFLSYLLWLLSTVSTFMLYPARGHGRALLLGARPSARLNTTSTAAAATTTSTITSSTTICLSQQRRWVGAKINRKPAKGQRLLIELCKAQYPLAEELKSTGVWLSSSSSKPGPKPKNPKKTVKSTPENKVAGDRTRINVVNQDLVRDTIDYIKPTLARHAGCDLISIYPGAGLWSTALHDAVQPRSHLLLEPDEDLYRPFLKPLLQQPGVRIVPKSGIVWNELNEVLTPEYLPQQVEIPRSLTDPIPCNDTLLVSINLAMYPKRRFSLFDSMSRMVLYQLVTSLRSSSLFQKYGRVRMLVWIPDDEKGQLLPRVLHHRARLAIEGELCTEYIAEVCGEDIARDLQGRPNPKRDILLDAFAEKDEGKKAREEKGWSTKRWGQVDMESIRLALNRMHEAGIKTPEGRASFHFEQFSKLGLPLDKPVDLTKHISFTSRQTGVELEALQKRHGVEPMDRLSSEYKRMQAIRHYHARLDRELAHSQEFVRGYDRLLELYHRAATAIDPAERDRLSEEARLSEEQWDEAYAKMPMYLSHSATSARDMFHLVRQPADLGPVLNWDRRPYEPLPVSSTDFFPNISCSLLDIQPKMPDPLLRAMGSGSNKSGDIFDLMLGSLLAQRRKPVVELMDSMWPGMRDGVLPHCTSLRDPAQGGVVAGGSSSISARVLNQVQLMEILREFMRWPFRPTYQEMVGRHVDDGSEEKFGVSSGPLAEDDHPMGNQSLESF